MQVENIGPTFELDPSRPLWILGKKGKKREEKGTWKGNAKVDSEIVTQMHVTLDSLSCTVPRVSELIRRQLDMVVLLDSKCYPLMDNDSTRGASFWKSSRKVLAANKALYRKASGESMSLGRVSIDLTRNDSSEESDSSKSSSSGPDKPAQKRPRVDLTSTLEEIAKGVSSIQGLFMFMKNMQ